MYIWDGLKPVLWDGTVSFSGSIPSTVSGVKSNNAAAPTSDNLGVLPAIANASAPSWTEGRQVLLSTDLSGALRVAATISTAGLATSAKQDTGNTSLASIDTKTPALGQALAAASVPVVLTTAQISTLTPLSSVTVTQGTAANLKAEVVGTGTFATQSTLQAGTALIGKVAASSESSTVYLGTTPATPKFAKIAASSRTMPKRRSCTWSSSVFAT